jgi:hypothetical protein
MVNETCHLQKFIENVVEREFTFDNDIINEIYACTNYENCPYVNVKFNGKVNLPRLYKKQYRDFHIHLKLVPSGEEGHIILLDQKKGNNINSENFYTNIRYQNAIELLHLEFVEKKMKDTKKETLEIRIWNINKDTPYDITKSMPIGYTDVPLAEAIWHDGQSQVWNLCNEFGNKIGDISLTISFFNQHLPLPNGRISTIIWNQMVEDFVVTLAKQGSILLLNKFKPKPFTSMEFYSRIEYNQDFFLEISMQPRNVAELLPNPQTNVELRDSDLYIVHMFINGKLFFEFNTLNESTDYLLKNTLNEH